jgi:hypothetical protein
MYREIDKFNNRYDEKALFFSPNLSSLFFFVLLSYYNIRHCYISNKTNLYCLITMSFLNSVARLIGIYVLRNHKVFSPRILSQYRSTIMKSRYNVQLVRVEMSGRRFVVKVLKYMMFATMTFCLVYMALWFHHYEPMVL